MTAELSLEGLVAWHRVTEQEAGERTIELDHDALLLAVALDDPLTATVGDDLVELRIPTDEAGELDAERGPLLDLPADWAPALAAGDLVGYAEDDDHLALVLGPTVAEQAPEPDASAVDGLRRALDAVAGDHRQPLLLAGDPDADAAPAGAWVLHLDDVGTVLLADHGEAVRALDRPLVELAEAAGLRVEDGTVLGPDVTEQDLALYAMGRAVILDAFPAEDLEPGVAEAAGVAWIALSGASDDREGLAANASAFLGDPTVAEALALRMWDLDDADAAAVLEQARGLAAPDPAAPGPGLVLAEALLRTGAPAEARELLAHLASGSPAPDPEEWAALHEAHGQMSAHAGDVAAAQAAFRRIGENDAAARLQRWRATPPPGVGRNDRCPCGSGRKAKQCCLLHPPEPDLAARVPFLWWKLERACLQVRRREIPWPGPASTMAEAIPLDAVLVEDGALADVAAVIGPLLPADERDLVAGWSAVARSLYEVEEETGDGVVVHDLVADTTLVVTAQPDEGPATVGDVWLAVLVPGPDETLHVVGPVLHPPPPARALLLEALGAGLDGQQLVDLVSVLVD